MKTLNKLISIVLTAVLVLSLCACSLTIGTHKTKTDVCIKVNSEPLDKEYIAYFFYVAKMSMISEAGYTADNSSEKDIELYWKTTEIEGVNAVDVARDVAADNAVFQKVQYLKAVEEGIVLSDEQLSMIEANIQDAALNNGGTKNFEKLLEDMGTDMLSYKQIITENVYISELYNLYDSKNMLEITDEEFNAFIDNHSQEYAPEMMLDAAKKDKFNSIAKKWETDADIIINDEAMKQFEV